MILSTTLSVLNDVINIIVHTSVKERKVINIAISENKLARKINPFLFVVFRTETAYIIELITKAFMKLIAKIARQNKITLKPSIHLPPNQNEQNQRHY